jgi:hypothetical protein
MRKVSLIMVCLMVLILPIEGQDKPSRMMDFNHEDLVSLAQGSYALYGSNLITARIICQGLQRDNWDPWFILSMADFFFEDQKEVAAVLYLYLYQKKQAFDMKLHNSFMIMFSDAMYQYGLSKHKTKEAPLTVGDIYNYSDFEFNIGALEQHAAAMTKEFGSIDNFVLIIESSLGMSCGFVEKMQSKNIADYFPDKVHWTKEFDSWLEGYPQEVKRIQEIKK